MKKLALFAIAAVLASSSLPALAQFQKPEDAVKYRKAAFTVLGAHFGRIGAMANGKAPFDAKLAAENAAVVESMSKLPFAAFGPGTDAGETRARPEIWSEAAKFKKAADTMQAAAVDLHAAAKTGNLDAVKTAFGAAGKSCKACHDAFRED